MTAAGLQVLMIDDEIQIRRFLRISLTGSGYVTHEAADGESGILKAAQVRPDIIILDMGLPDMDGLDVLQRIREWTQTPVIILSVRDADQDKVKALDAGADDYLTKPFSTDELLARIRVALRHAAPAEQSQIFKAGELQVDLTRRLVTLHGDPVRLTPTEYALLRLMIQHAGKVLTHRQILREVWGREYENETHYLRVYFAQLRQKLEADPTRPALILTEPGIGYRLQSG
ncbi:MAG: response regulator [Pleurocapsa minor GSE-CHR-MK-17-07R]|jgi:two-component system KDP operon response regulator KdpE|nr:response regulator [Pleurocapsa minor GSE-CHR-MK 17-07R]